MHKLFPIIGTNETLNIYLVNKGIRTGYFDTLISKTEKAVNKQYKILSKTITKFFKNCFIHKIYVSTNDKVSKIQYIVCHKSVNDKCLEITKEPTKPSNIHSVKIGEILGYPKPIDILNDNIDNMNKYSVNYIIKFADADKQQYYKYNRESESVIKMDNTSNNIQLYAYIILEKDYYPDLLNDVNNQYYKIKKGFNKLKFNINTTFKIELK